MESPKNAFYKVKVETPKGVIVDLKDVSYDEAFSTVDSLAKSTKDETLKEYLEQSLRCFGFTGMSGRSYSVSVSAYLPRTSTGEKQTCGRRMSEVGPWEYKENLDEWEQIGSDKVCSFCGSLHPDSVLEIVKTFGIERLEASTKGYKWYVSRPDTPNASLGGIKYYRHHDTPEFLEALKQLLPEK